MSRRSASARRSARGCGCFSTGTTCCCRRPCRSRRPMPTRASDDLPNPNNFPELDALYLAVQSDKKPVLLDPVRLRGRAADRADGHGSRCTMIWLSCRRAALYEEAAGPAWPSPELAASLDRIARQLDDVRDRQELGKPELK